MFLSLSAKAIQIIYQSGLMIMLSAVLSVAQAATINLRILATSDLHAYLMDFDYYKDQPTEKFGLVRTASLIQQAREEVSNHLLFDNGDLIQGNPMGDYWRSQYLNTKTEVRSAFNVMNALQYDAATLGNHEFNFGLPFLRDSLKKAEFPYVCANVILKNGEPLVQPFVMLSRQFMDEEGQVHPFKVGVIGVVPPQILVWDKLNLSAVDGTSYLTVFDIKESIEKYVPMMKAQGADLIVVLAHSGYSAKPYVSGAENMANVVSQIQGVDVVISGHSHGLFPSENFSTLSKDIDLKKGLIHGKPSVMTGFWGSHLGVIDLTLHKSTNEWKVVTAQAQLRPIYNDQTQSATVEGVPELRRLLAVDHEGTRAFVGQEIGQTQVDLYSYLALLQNDAILKLINASQKDYVKRFLQASGTYKDLPILSAAAPFKVGGRKNDPQHFVEIPKGALRYRHSVDIYPFPNTLVALKVTGRNIREWLECSASMFKQIQTETSQPQSLIHWEGFRTYNFDVIDGITYLIDITQPAKYDRDCQVVQPDAQRITDILFEGKPLDEKAEFILATNNYRAYGNKFSGAHEDNVILATTEEMPVLLANYIQAQTKIQGGIHLQPDQNWRFVPIKSSVPLTILFETANSLAAAQFIQDNAIYPMKKNHVDEQGFAVYEVDLSKINDNNQ